MFTSRPVVLVTEYFQETYPDEHTAIVEAFGTDAVVTNTRDLREGDTVIPRYRMIPFGDILESEVEAIGATLVNSWSEHLAIDDIFTWAKSLDGFTAPAWSLTEFRELDVEGRFFVKGQVNSLKNRGPEHVFADSKEEAISLAEFVGSDDWLSSQDVVIRPVQDYKWLGTSSQGLPIFNEYRVFIHRGKVLAYSHYWEAQSSRFLKAPESLGSVFSDFLEDLGPKVSGVSSFVVADVAEYSDGSWSLVELNDPCHSGVPVGMDCGELFRALRESF